MSKREKKLYVVSQASRHTPVTLALWGQRQDCKAKASLSFIMCLSQKCLMCYQNLNSVKARQVVFCFICLYPSYHSKFSRPNPPKTVRSSCIQPFQHCLPSSGHKGNCKLTRLLRWGWFTVWEAFSTVLVPLDILFRHSVLWCCDLSLLSEIVFSMKAFPVSIGLLYFVQSTCRLSSRREPLTVSVSYWQTYFSSIITVPQSQQITLLMSSEFVNFPIH